MILLILPSALRLPRNSAVRKGTPSRSTTWLCWNDGPIRLTADAEEPIAVTEFPEVSGGHRSEQQVPDSLDFWEIP